MDNKNRSYSRIDKADREAIQNGLSKRKGCREIAFKNQRRTTRKSLSPLYNPIAYTAMPARIRAKARTFFLVIFSLKIRTPNTVTYK